MRIAAIIFIAILATAEPGRSEVSVTNFKPGEEIRYPAPLIRGSCSENEATAVKITNLSARDRPAITGVAKDGSFIGLTHLAEGENKLQIECGQEKSTFTLIYKPQTNRHIVRSIYVIDNKGDTNYQTPLEDDPQNYKEKFGTAMLLLQSLTAEWMNDQGFGRRTFNLELDGEQKVIVRTYEDERPKEHYFGMNDQKWWREIYGLLERAGYTTREAKNVAVTGYTYFDPEKKKVFAHTALGGGGLGLFGSGGMFTWPNSLEDTFRAFSDSTPVDPNIVHNDSAGRTNHWGMAATTIGAVCHELGHTFGLPHVTDRRGIMARGFDHLNRMFAFEDAPSSRRHRVLGPWKNALPYWAPHSGSFLRYSRYFTLDDVDYSKDERPGLSVKQNPDSPDKITVSAHHGVRFVGISGKGDSTKSHDAFHKDSDVRTEIEYSLKELAERAGQNEFVLRIMDSRGNYRRFASKDFVSK